jgi:hypothetical protein
MPSLGGGGFRPAHVASSDVQLAGSSALMNPQSTGLSAVTTVAQVGSVLTPWVKAAAWSAMQAEYSATVARRRAGRGYLAATGALGIGLQAEFRRFTVIHGGVRGRVPPPHVVAIPRLVIQRSHFAHGAGTERAQGVGVHEPACSHDADVLLLLVGHA